jgi:glycosyltransferase involved in cell wall biosynthesis
MSQLSGPRTPSLSAPSIAASVIVCSHNPRPENLRHTLNSLKLQLLQVDRWELILVDNASVPPISDSSDLTWHPNARHIREEELGLTPARLRGIRESYSDLLVFVDDDNVLGSDYLEAALDVAGKHSHIGAFGGSIRGDFEIPPPDWIRPYLPGLAISEISKDCWSNFLLGSNGVPYGAGLCVRRSVAENYSSKVQTNPLRKALDRVGGGLGSGGDNDLVWCAIDLGMGVGRFANLLLTHLVPADRLTVQYVVRLYSGFAASSFILTSFRGVKTRREAPLAASLRWALRFVRSSPVERRIMLASRKAQEAARKALAGGDTRLIQL